MKESDMRHIAQCIALVLKDYKNKEVQAKVKEDIAELVSGHPLYPGMTVLE